MWQALRSEVHPRGAEVVTVALDTGGADAARPWIEAAQPAHPSLIDAAHVTDELFGFVNVPNAVWIDEEGRIVRPAETAGTGDEFRSMVSPGGIPPDDLQRMMTRRQRYVDAIKDWVRNGTDMASPTDRTHTADDAQAFAHFRFGTWLWHQGREDEAQQQLAEAKRLKPESWAFRRQSWELEEVGKAGGPDFWNAVEALGDRPYYPPPEMARLDEA